MKHIARASLPVRALALALAAASAAALASQDLKNVTMFTSNFEDGSLQGWRGRGSGATVEKVEVVSGNAHGGTKALSISNRSTTWQGPIHFLTDKVVPGDIYRVSAWISYDQGPAQAAFTLSVERSFKDPAASHAYTNVASVQAKKGEWTPITVDYTVPGDPNQASIEVYFERPYKSDDQAGPDDKIPFMIDDVTAVKLDPNFKLKIQDDIPSLKRTLGDAIAIGAAVAPENVDGTDAHGRLIMKHFNVLTPGNAMKWDAIEPKEGQFNWAGADKIVRFAGLTGSKVRGHTLVWHSQTPAWVFQDPGDPSKPASKELLEKRMVSHIRAVMEHFEGDVESWDVVNEALSDSSGLRTGAEGSKWFEILGPGFIDTAFRTARAADPEAILVYNDYNVESDPRKLAETVKLVKGMKSRGVPIDAVGLQMHVRIADPSIALIKDAIAQLGALGVKVQITELDVSIYANAAEAKKAPGDDILLAQAQRYKDLFKVFKDAAAKGWLDTVVLWGLADDGSWLDDFPVQGRPDAPLLFDRRLQAKPAFWALVDPSKVKGLK
jgi:endo-1,4-beta-xylanase